MTEADRLKFEQHDRELAALNKIVITGNGSPPLTARVARIEQQNSAMSRLIWILIAQGVAVMGGIATLILRSRFGA